MSVLVSITHGQCLAVGKPYPARTLDMQEEQTDRIIDPGKFVAGKWRFTVVDLGATEVGYNACALETATYRSASQLRIKLAEVDRQ